ncbi:MAG: acetoin utilization protein AcuC [Nitriliruptorales bacterium]|nr:acetoin utilization protein AcuC [Nitriliruptorales bacterium]
MAGEGPNAVGRVALVWNDQISYDFGAGHPLAPIRVELTVDLIRELGLVDGQRVVEVLPEQPAEEEVLRLHRPEFIRAVRRVSADPSIRADWQFGLGPGDNPVFPGMHQASLDVCAASKEAARQVWEGHADHAFNPAGGLHHAMPDRAAGFCIYNDPAVAIDWLLEHGAERIVYVDVDVHHGDGVEVMFADDPRVLTISLHESGRFLFPGTGASEDIGGRGAPGSAANIPFHPGTTGSVWLDSFDAIVEPLVRAFAPDILVTQLGCDTHATDPLAHLALTVDEFARIVGRLHRLAHDVCGGRWVATGGGGYQWVQVVPRSWTLAFAEMCEASLPAELPASWREAAARRTGEVAPVSFHDEPVLVSDAVLGQARAAADEAVTAVRRLVLSRHGAG